MSSPLPAAPTPPDLPSLPTLPSNPLPRLSIGHPGGARLPRLRLPTGATRRAPRPPIGHRPPQSGAGRPPVAPAPRTVVNVQAAPTKPPVAPMRAAGARPTAGQEREANRTFLGDKLGGSLNRLPRASRERMRTLLRDHGREYHHGYHQAGVDYLRGKIEERRTQRTQQRALDKSVAARQREQLHARAAGIQRTDLAETPAAAPTITPPEAPQP